MNADDASRKLRHMNMTTTIHLSAIKPSIILLICACFWAPSSVKAGDSLKTDVQRITAEVEEGLAPSYILEGVNDQQKHWGILERMDYWHVPGVSVAVINHGKIEWAKGYGEAEAGGRAVGKETIFQTGSLGKTVTAVTVLALVDRGVLKLDRDVNDYLVSWHLPDTSVAEGEPVTLERILNHSAGLTVHGFGGYDQDDSIPTLQQILNGEPPCNSGSVRIGWKPGSEWRYSGGGYIVAQQIIGDVTGRPFLDVVKDLVLGPLGMSRTFYRARLDKALMRDAAMGHTADGSMLSGGYRVMPEYGAGAGLWSTASDLARLGCSIMRARAGSGDEPITPGSVRSMLAARLGGYGLGVFVRGQGKEFEFYHGGDNTGFHCFMIMFPELGQGAVIMTNGDHGTQLYDEILHGLANAYDWPDLKTIRSAVVDVDSARLSDLAGSYEVAGLGNVPLTLEDGQLHVPDILGDGHAIPLYPVDSLIFVNPTYGWIFSFKRPASGTTADSIWTADVTFGVYHLSAAKVE